MNTGIIYKATSPSGKIYVGQTVRALFQRKNRHYSDAFNKNYKGYNGKIATAIRKYGDNIDWTILHTNVAINDLNELEIEEINKHNSYKSGYNSTEGGGGCKGFSQSKEARRKMSEYQKRKRHSAETRKKISESHKGKKHSTKTRNKISKTNSGENHGRAKLNLKRAQEIRVKYATGKYTYRSLSKEYSVDKATISRVINNLRWNS